MYIAYDGDAAGQNATIRGLDILSAEGIDVRVIVFPGGQDPDEFIRANGKDAFDTLKDNALSLNAFKLESMARAYTLTDENDRERYAMEACRFIASLQPVEQGRYYAQLARKTGYPVEALEAQGAAGSPAGKGAGAAAGTESPSGARRGGGDAACARGKRAAAGHGAVPGTRRSRPFPRTRCPCSPARRARCLRGRS